MKVGLATTLSVAGVLAAGAAAFAVNSSVLGGTADVAVGLPATSNSDAVAPNGDASGATLTNVSDSPAMATDAKKLTSNSGVTTYSVGDAGNVVVDITDGSIVLRDVVPNSGWESALVLPGPNGSWRIHFTKGLMKKELRLSMLADGRIVAQIIDESGQSTPPAFNPNAPTDSIPPSLTGDDDSGDDHNNESDDNSSESQTDEDDD